MWEKFFCLGEKSSWIQKDTLILFSSSKKSIDRFVLWYFGGL